MCKAPLYGVDKAKQRVLRATSSSGTMHSLLCTSSAWAYHMFQPLLTPGLQPLPLLPQVLATPTERIVEVEERGEDGLVWFALLGALIWMLREIGTAVEDAAAGGYEEYVGRTCLG
jgi:hypothetical protein